MMIQPSQELWTPRVAPPTTASETENPAELLHCLQTQQSTHYNMSQKSKPRVDKECNTCRSDCDCQQTVFCIVIQDLLLRLSLIRVMLQCEHVNTATCCLTVCHGNRCGASLHSWKSVCLTCWSTVKLRIRLRHINISLYPYCTLYQRKSHFSLWLQLRELRLHYASYLHQPKRVGKTGDKIYSFLKKRNNKREKK